MDPKHHGTLTVRIRGGSPYINAQTILAGLAIVPFEHERVLVDSPSRSWTLWTNLAVIKRAAHACPRLRLFRRHKSGRARGGCRIRDSFECVNPVACVAANLSRGCIYSGRRVGQDEGA